MCRGQYSHFVGQSLLSSFEVIKLENIAVMDHAGCHHPYDPPQMTIAPFCYPASSLMLTGLVNCWIQSCHGNDFPGTFILIDVATHFNEKIGGSLVPDSLNGSHDVDVFFHQFTAHLNQHVRYLLKGVFKVKKQRYLLFKNHIFGGTVGPYR